MPDKPDQLRLEYVPLDAALLWEDNRKLHDIGSLTQSFQKHGFKDPMKFEPTLNGGRGGFVEGNGRCEALARMEREGGEPPRGVLLADDGRWLVPVLFGVDARSEAAAEAYGIDHNAITMKGGDFDVWDHMRMWDDGFVDDLERLADLDELPTAFDGDDVDHLLSFRDSEVPSLDELEEQYGEPGERDFWPIIKVQVAPETFALWESLVEQTGVEDPALAAAQVIEAVDASILGSL